MSPGSPGADVRVVVSPGFDLRGFLPVAQQLRENGAHVRMIELPCGGGLESSADSLVGLIGGPETIVVAHGIGATIAMIAAPRVDVRGYVLLAPILDVIPTGSVHELVDRAESGTLGEITAADAVALRTSLLGAHAPPLGCLSPSMAGDLAAWVHTGDSPLRLSEITDPVWLAVSLGDDLATVETTVPASREIADHTLIRLGRNRLDPQDYEHGEMLTGRTPIRAASKAVEKLE